MAKYELLPTTAFSPCPYTHPVQLPEVVHLEDPALAVMIDFKQSKPSTIRPTTPIDYAMHEMKISGVHLMLVVDDTERVIGLISSEDVIGEKPIKLIQEGRLTRAEILVRMVMTPAEDIIAFDIEALRLARVGNVINTLREHHQHYALVLQKLPAQPLFIRGLLWSSQISKQLHMDITNSISQAATGLGKLHKSHS